MRPQTIGLTIAAAVTGVFLLAVGIVVSWQWAESQPRPDRHAQHQKAPQPDVGVDVNVRRFNGNIIVNEPFDAAGNLQIPNEQRIANDDVPNFRGANVAAKDVTLSGPHAHANLAIFLIHGPDVVNNQRILTLQEGLEQNVAVVHETGTGQLFIDNRGNAPLFIQSGDIVKGGTQDRVLPYDMLVGARSNRTPIAALCVESGRSFKRGNEISTSFQTATEQLPTRSLKLAAVRRSQADVWNNVTNLQAALARTTGGSVQGAQSTTSLQLSLEHQRVRAAVENYFTPLVRALDGHDDVIGYAVVINGKVQSADVYGSAGLFQKLWPKLLRASAVDALAERQANTRFDLPTQAAVQTFLSDAEYGQPTRIPTAGRSQTIFHETPHSLLFDTCDLDERNAVLHRNYLAK